MLQTLLSLLLAEQNRDGMLIHFKGLWKESCNSDIWHQATQEMVQAKGSEIYGHNQAIDG